MVYRRRFKRSYRRRTRGYRRRSYRRYARRVFKAVNSLAEKKYNDYIVENAVGTSGTLSRILYGIEQGTGQNQRIGNQIMNRYVKMRLQINSQDEDGIYFRVALLRARTSGAQLSTLPSGANAHTAMIDIDVFEILYDRVFSLGDADTNGKNKQFINKTVRIMKRNIWNAPAANTIVTNELLLYTWSNDVITTGFNCQGTVRIYFTDL